MYRAIITFCDLKDGGRSYAAGEEYPRPGLTVTKARLQELSTNDNLMGFPLIALVESEKRDHKDLPAQDAKPAKKPRKARQKG